MSSNKELFNILETIASSLDITNTQYELAKQRYEAIGKWLSEGEYCLFGQGKKQCFKDGEIYAQGSIQLETVVKPIGQNEFDIDLVFYTPNISHENITPEYLKELIGNRLREHGTYKNMLQSINRGWRINYADEFHLDITPSLDKIDEPYNESELVPDKKLEKYMPSNPKGYFKWVDNSANLAPRVSITKQMFESHSMDVLALEDSATVSDFPEHTKKKPLLKRFIQIFKRHRDIVFDGKDNAPISIIITTLATHSYLECIQNNAYNNEYDLMIETLKNMPNYIEERYNGYWIQNPTVDSENFAEKWNTKPIKKTNFDNWHIECQNFFEQFNPNMGQNVLLDSIEKGFGTKASQLIREEYIKKLDKDRKLGILSTPLAGSTSVKANNFFGN